MATCALKPYTPKPYRSSNVCSTTTAAEAIYYTKSINLLVVHFQNLLESSHLRGVGGGEGQLHLDHFETNCDSFGVLCIIVHSCVFRV